MARILISIVVFSLFSVVPLSAGEVRHWGYERETGPERWGELAAEFDMCARGRNQSPIDLVANMHVDDLPELLFEYTHPGSVEEINTGHAIQETVPPGNHLIFEGNRFELKQFHFHSPSEHQVGGESFPMEIHLVHQSAAGAYAVVGLLVTEGPENDLMNRLPSFRAARGDDPYADPIDYNQLFPNRTEYFLYNGSLTTPPCTEGVQWIVLKEPLVASPGQIRHFHDLLGFDNNRPVQPHNSRVVVD